MVWSWVLSWMWLWFSLMCLWWSWTWLWTSWTFCNWISLLFKRRKKIVHFGGYLGKSDFAFRVNSFRSIFRLALYLVKVSMIMMMSWQMKNIIMHMFMLFIWGFGVRYGSGVCRAFIDGSVDALHVSVTQMHVTRWYHSVISGNDNVAEIVTKKS